MSDLGSDAGSTSLSLMAKALEAILKLIEKIIDTWQRAPERKAKQFEVKEAQSKMERRKALNKVDGKIGFVREKELQKAGVALTSIGIHMAKEDMRELNAICKREGILFTGVVNRQLQKDGGKDFYVIKCKGEDLELMKRAIDRLNDEKRIQGIDDRMSEILSKGEENLTDEDIAMLSALQKEKENIQNKSSVAFNHETSEGVVERAVYGETLKEMSIEEALNRITGRSIDKDQYSIVADASDPSKYIKCHGYMDTYNGQSYIKTDYEVYKNGKQVLATHDGRFDGRPKNYWINQREKIAAVGEFSGAFFKFRTEKEFNKWAEYVRQENTAELHTMEKPGEAKNYEEIKNALNEQLHKNGAEWKDGIVVDKESGNPLVLNENMNPEQKAIVAESVVIGKQIGNYETIELLNRELTIANAQLLISTEGTVEHAEALQRQSATQEKYNSAIEREDKLIIERKNINAVQAEQQTAIEREADIEKQDGRRQERVDEHDEKQMTMEEAKGAIEQEKALEGAKASDFTDKSLKEQIKMPKDKGER